MPAYDVGTIRRLVIEIRKPKSEAELKGWMPQIPKDIWELYHFSGRIAEWQGMLPVLDDVRDLYVSGVKALKLGKRWLKGMPCSARGSEPDKSDHWMTLPGAVQEMYEAFRQGVYNFSYDPTLDYNLTNFLYNRRYHFDRALASAIALVCHHALDLGSLVQRSNWYVKELEDMLDDLERALAILSEALADVASESEVTSIVPLVAGEKSGRLEGEHYPAPSISSSPFVGTLERLKRCTRQIEIVRYLRDRPEHEAELKQIAIDVFRVREAHLGSRMKSVRKQIERTRENLDSEGCPLRLVINANSVRLVSAQMSP
jgi:hypothetical protein